MISEKEIKADLKNESKRFLELYAKGVIHFQAIDRIKLLKKVLGQKHKTKAERVYDAFSKRVVASYR